MAGLLVGSGVGLLVLFRTNRNMKENLKITAMLYVMGVAGGMAVELLARLAVRPALRASQPETIRETEPR